MTGIKRKLLSGILGLCVLLGVVMAGVTNAHSPSSDAYDLTNRSLIERGRYIVTSVGGCVDCHSVGRDPNDPTWLAGYIEGTPGQPFEVGPFQIYPANITPDQETGIGSWTPKQVFNAFRLGQDKDGNTLCPPMPWPVYRNMTDLDIWSVVAYLKNGVKPVKNEVPDNVAPDGTRPDCSSLYQDLKPLPPFPGANEIRPRRA